MATLLGFAACLAVFPYILFPILIKRTQRFRKTPRLRLVLPEFLPSWAKKHFDSNHKDLLKDGFLPCFDAVSYDHAPQLQVYLRVYIERKQNIFAVSTVLLPNDETEKPLKIFLEFVSRFQDGSEINTNNIDLIGAPIEPPSKILHTFQFIRTPKVLLRLHKHFVTKFKNRTAAILPNEGCELESFQHHMGQDLKSQEKMGGLIGSANDDFYSPTWAGAFLMAWYTMWPARFIRKFYKQHKAKIWLKRLNVEPV